MRHIEYLLINMANQKNLIYFAGENLVGTVKMKINERIKIRSVILTVSGRADVHWSETPSNKFNDRILNMYKQTESFLKKSSHLIPNPKNGDFYLEIGEFSYPFSIKLPENLPSSFDSKDGRVVYNIKLNIDIPWALDQGTSIVFNVISNLDLNLSPNLKVSSSVSSKKYTGFIPCISDVIRMKMDIKRTGFVPGESLSFSTELDNRSSREYLHSICVKLVQVICLKAEYKEIIGRNDVAVLYSPKKVEAHTIEQWNDLMLIPVLSPTLKGLCKIIEIHYFIVLCLKTGDSNISYPNILAIPITIGSIPFNDSDSFIDPNNNVTHLFRALNMKTGELTEESIRSFPGNSTFLD